MPVSVDDETRPFGEAELRERLTKWQIIDLLVDERRARDLALWEVMRASYATDSEIDISWFHGTGSEFTDASAKRYDAGARSLHQLGPSTVKVSRDKATADTPITIVLIGHVNGVALNVVSHIRVYQRLIRPSGKWLIAGMRAIHQTDMLVPVNPNIHVELDSELFSSYRRSYGAMAFLQASNGRIPRNDLPGIDEPDSVIKVLAGEEAWLAS